MSEVAGEQESHSVAAAPFSIGEWVPLDVLVPWEKNPRKNDGRPVAKVAASIRSFGFVSPIVIWSSRKRMVAGHTRLKALRSLVAADPLFVPKGAPGPGLAPVRFHEFASERQANLYAIADNRLGELAEWDDEVLAEVVADYTPEELSTAGVEEGTSAPPDDGKDEARATLAQRFGVPPFSVLDARQGYWQDRKRAWIALGLRSELGRGGAMPQVIAPDGRDTGTGGKDYTDAAKAKRGTMAFGGGADKQGDAAAWAAANKPGAARRGLLSKATERKGYGADYDTENGENAWGGSGTSIFDPVLCELAVRWFSPPGGAVLDPFAGGSVRGIVAAKLGRAYTGIELRGEQVAANRVQAAEVGCELLERAPALSVAAAAPDYMPEQTPVERHGGIWFKRDDTFTVAGVAGGKVRTCWGLAQGATGLVTAGSRSSPQVNIVAHIARRLGIPCRVHTPAGTASPEVMAAVACGAERIEQRPGHNNVIVARARTDAAERGWVEIPFGMECQEAVNATRSQVASIPAGAKRLVVPCGSGMSLAGILWGLKDAGRALPVVAVVVGAAPEKRLDKWAPEGWRGMVELVPSGTDYHVDAASLTLPGVPITFDPVYEAKCLPFLQDGDCMWCVGIRQTALPGATTAAPGATTPTAHPVWIEGDSRDIPRHVGDAEFDFVFSCPPYADLEVYSDDPRDLSTLDYDSFRGAYAEIIAHAVAKLRQDRFACFVVGDVRDKAGIYRNFVGDTIAAFQAAGARYYNEGILVTAVGSLPVRAGRSFAAARKLGKTHQNVLVFVKGDPKKATAACGAVDVTMSLVAAGGADDAGGDDDTASPEAAE